MRVNTESVHFSADEKLLMYIQQKIEKLSNFFDKIIDARVTLKLENSGQVKEKVVEVKINVPGDVLFIKETNKSFEYAIDRAVESLKRQLIKYKERLRNR
jgi:putative sigma-54 modulation protein